MSRWTDQFDSHAIHETIRQSREWSEQEFDEADSEREAERRRLNKVLGVISEALEGMDRELFPEADLTNLNNHLRQQQFWNQLKSFSSSGSAQNLRTANDHISTQASRISAIASQAKPVESRVAIENAEEAANKFCKSLEKKKKEFEETIAKQNVELSDLKQKAAKLEATVTQLTKETEEALNTWRTEHTEAQNARSTEFSQSEIERSKTFETSQKERAQKASEQLEKIFKDLEDRISTSEEKFEECVEKITSDMRAKHQSILTLHEIVANDGVAGGYKKTAKDEGKAANLWRNVAMGAFVAASLWTMFKVFAYWMDWVSTAPGQFDWGEVIAATSLTLILLATAAYAARQSKLHRVNEQQMSWFSLEVSALDPFIASLTEDQQQVLKMQLSQRLFGQNRVAVANEENVRENETDLVKTLLDAVAKFTARDTG